MRASRVRRHMVDVKLDSYIHKKGDSWCIRTDKWLKNSMIIHNLHTPITTYTSKNCEIGRPYSLVRLSLRQSVRHVFEFTRSLFDYWKNILICSVS